MTRAENMSIFADTNSSSEVRQGLPGISVLCDNKRCRYLFPRSYILPDLWYDDGIMRPMISHNHLIAFNIFDLRGADDLVTGKLLSFISRSRGMTQQSRASLPMTLWPR